MENNLQGSRVIIAFPGIGSVSVLAANYILKNMKHKVFASLYSDDMPAVLLNDMNDFRLPAVRLIRLETKEKVVLCYGDSQPNTDPGAYKLSREIIATLKESGVKEVVTLGGIGIKGERRKTSSYYMSNSKESAEKLEKLKVADKLSERVNVIFGMTGLIYGMASKEGLNASMLLVEANGSPGYMDTSASTRMIELLSSYMDLGINIKEIQTNKKKEKKAKYSVEKRGRTEEDNRFKEHYLG